METSLSEKWVKAFRDVVMHPRISDPLKTASIDENLRHWTTLLTDAVVESCHQLDWQAAAKGHTLYLLPQKGQEYLGLDAVAFDVAPGQRHSSRWPFPVAVFELENSLSDDRVAYSLWKVMCVKAGLRVVFAYRRDSLQVADLVNSLKINVVSGIPSIERARIFGEILLVIGNRSDGEAFPWGFFKFWHLDLNAGSFVKP